MSTKLIWVTANAQQLIAQIARVSSDNPENPEIEKLLNYMIRKKHWSPFEMASACIEIKTTRDIARQILRHRSFSFQEFSQRYARGQMANTLRETRLQDLGNRQSSLPCYDEELQTWWKRAQDTIARDALELYGFALEKGIAKEVARCVLPEGLTATHMYISGTIRSWIHYIQVRTSNETQKEHREIATEIQLLLEPYLPIIWSALGFGRSD